MRRRSLLSSLGTGALVGMTGSTSHMGKPVEITEIAVYNHSTEAYQVRVRLHVSRETVYDRTRALSARHGKQDVASVVFEDLPADKRDYAVSYKLVERTDWQRESLDGIPDDCIEGLLPIHDDGSGPTVSFLTSDCK